RAIGDGDWAAEDNLPAAIGACSLSTSIQRFDITSPESRALVLEHFAKYGWIYSPQLWLGLKIWKGVRSLGANAAAKEAKAQRKAAVDIIRAGKEHGVDELEITMSQDAGVGLGSSIEGFPIQF